MEKEPIGFLPCRSCGEIKSVYQGSGRNADFLYSKCGCGTDTRKGAPVQEKLAAHLPLADAQLALNPPEEIKPPKPAPDNTSSEDSTDDKPSSFFGWGVFALVVGTAALVKRLGGAA